MQVSKVRRRGARKQCSHSLSSKLHRDDGEGGEGDGSGGAVGALRHGGDERAGSRLNGGLDVGDDEEKDLLQRRTGQQGRGEKQGECSVP